MRRIVCLAEQAVDRNSDALPSDGHDSFVTGTPSEFVRRFREFDCDVLFGAESVNWPGQNTQVAPARRALPRWKLTFTRAQQPEQVTRYRFLNSGGYMGRAGVLRDMFSTPLRDSDDDQLYCQSLYTSGRWRVALDVHKRVFCPLADHVGADAPPVRMQDATTFLVTDTATQPLQL